jgi:hypothetical protein
LLHVDTIVAVHIASLTCDYTLVQTVRGGRLLFNGLSDVFKGNRVLICFIYALLGMSAGALSLLVLPHRLIRHPIGFHGISLLISPIVVGFVLSYVGAVMERRGKKLTGLETFGYSFAFAFGMTFIRFLFAK